MTDALINAGSAEAADSPDWSTIEGEFPCPLCRYNLRGLNVPRCPECGYRFEWKEVFDPNRREHPYLFEHHSERNFWSFRKTALGALRPKRFWTSLHPVMPSRPGRLLAYWVITAIPFVALASVVLFAPDIIGFAWKTIQGPSMPFWPGFFSKGGWSPVAWRGATGYSPVWDYMANLGSSVRESDESLWTLFGMLAAWPVLTLASLMVFRWSMARARIRSMHVVRCVAYSFDMVPAALLVAATLLMLAGYAFVHDGPEWLKTFVLMLLWSATLVLCCRRLRFAYALYLRFDRPFLTIIASQLMVVLVMLNVHVATNPVWLQRFLRSILR